MEKLSVWRWTKDPSKFIIDRRAPFLGSETFSQEWQKVGSFSVLNPLFRPIPKGLKLFVAQRVSEFPYHTNRVSAVDNLFFPEEDGTFYIAPEKHLELIAASTFKHIALIENN